MLIKRFALVFFLLIGSYPVTVSAVQVSEARINQILAMTPTKMAKTGAWTVAAYNRLMGYVNSIKDEELRTFTLDMLTDPKSTVFNATAAPDALRTAPATGGPGHHHYPGGLVVHLLENIEIALGWMNTFEAVHGIRTTDRDLIIAELALHDWSKVWYNWDESIGKVKKPDWFPKSWGGKRRNCQMGMDGRTRRRGLC